MDNNTLLEAIIRYREKNHNKWPSGNIAARYTDDDLITAMRTAEEIGEEKIARFIDNLWRKRLADIRHAPLKTQQLQTQQQRSQSASLGKVQQNNDNTLVEDIIQFRAENHNRWPSHDIVALYTNDDLNGAMLTAEALGAEEIAGFIGARLQDRRADIPDTPQKNQQSQTQQQRSWGTWLGEMQQKVQSWWTSPKE